MDDYLGEIEADFAAIYHILDYEDEPKLDGPKFVRLSSQLPRYDGAVRRRMELSEAQEGTGDSHVQTQFEVDNVNIQTGQTMTMKEALARSQGNSDGVLHAINQEHANSQYGALFEYEVG